jgi:hypothetical protein
MNLRQALCVIVMNEESIKATRRDVYYAEATNIMWKCGVRVMPAKKRKCTGMVRDEAETSWQRQ